MTLCDDVVCGLLRFPQLAGVRMKTSTRSSSFWSSLSHCCPLGSQRELAPSHQLSLLFASTLIDDHSRTFFPGAGTPWVQAGWEALCLTACWKDKSWSLQHNQAMFSNWARTFVISHQLWTLNRREKVGHFGTGFLLCQQSAIILTSFVWYKWEGDKCCVPARVY